MILMNSAQFRTIPIAININSLCNSTIAKHSSRFLSGGDMSRLIFTKAVCEKANPGRHYDARLAGFGLYVGKTGARSFFLEYRPDHGRGVS